MNEKTQTSAIESLNKILYDPDLSIDELEERLEFEKPWICLVYVECGAKCNDVCDPVT